MNEHREYCFDDFHVDPEAWNLYRDGEVIHLEPTVLKLLVFLIRNRDRLVTKEELMDTVWGDTVVSESALSKAVARLRKALDDLKKEGFDVRGFGDMSAGEISDLTGLAPDAAALAMEREFDEVFDFIEKNSQDWEKLLTDGNIKIKTNQHKVKFSFMEKVLEKFNLRITDVTYTDYYGIVFGIEKK